jgi:uncharacterized protein YhdP
MREAIAGDFIAHRGNAGRDCRVARERAAPRFAASGQLASAAAGKIESTTGVPVDVSQVSASWQNFGPTLDVRDINASLKDGGHLKIKRVTLALDVWQSLLHLRWQFRDLTFYQLQFLTNTPLSGGDSDQALKPTASAISSCVSSIISICATAK